MLIDVLETAANHAPEMALPSASRVLELIKWVPYATDGKSTKHFAQYLFPIVLKANRSAALELLRVYYREFAKWQSEEALEKYLLSRNEGDPEFLWALCGLIDPNDSVAARKSISKLFVKDSACSRGGMNDHASNYIKKMVNHRRWPDEISDERAESSGTSPQNSVSGNVEADTTYSFEGNQLTVSELKERCRISINAMIETIDYLSEQNEYVPNYNLLPTLHEHIANASADAELDAISEFCDQHVSSYEY